ncbi:hypothetical protein DFH09DRAFT_1159364 [Mycena vulgaris]|nr:hypothetical protein DFH09DRAFT_1159364 [Mycena vulgaris]
MGGGRCVLRAGRVLAVIGPGSVLGVTLALAPAPVRWMTARRWWLVYGRGGRFVCRALCSSRSWGMTAIRCLGRAGGRLPDGAVRALNDRRRGCGVRSRRMTGCVVSRSCARLLHFTVCLRVNSLKPNGDRRLTGGDICLWGGEDLFPRTRSLE